MFYSTNNRNQIALNGGVKSTGADPTDEEDMLNPRQEEIDRFNSSIHIEGGKRVFSYFWKVFYWSFF